MKVCFFARVPHRSLLERLEFYKQDIDILRELGHEVTLVTRGREIRTDVDLYFIWWWQWGFMPMLKNLFRKKPCIITGVFDYALPSGVRSYVSRPSWQQYLMRLALKRADANVFQSRFELELVNHNLEVSNPVYIPLGVNPEVFRFGTLPREDFVLTVAWMDRGNSKRKCVPEVVKAAALVSKRHPEVRFLIAGEKGSDYPHLARLATEFGVADRVDFLGVISRDRKIDLMQRCKVYLSPSQHEGFGLAILEAMSCGAPVISSPVGAVPEVVDGAGLLVDGTSPEAIAAAVNQYLEQEQLREEMGGKARQRAATLFPCSRRKEELAKVIADVLSHH